MQDSQPSTVASALLQQWKQAFEERDVEGLVALYADECFLFGGKAALSTGRRGVRAYFDNLPPARLQVEFGEQSVLRLAETVITSAGFVAFRRVDALPTRFRITLTFVLAGRSWKIVSHHASPVPA